ncbi:hypothetical protein K0M31_016242 [Melipona bicolor]|uniref:Uncharacterized protein n=1 Tax=Melipona bicolor TaxID=60889 RepID=A0AA40KTE4_9HYME|nr:hypothetical protein K0M31_016242 [Melipona bicolor]
MIVRLEHSAVTRKLQIASSVSVVRSGARGNLEQIDSVDQALKRGRQLVACWGRRGQGEPSEEEEGGDGSAASGGTGQRGTTDEAGEERGGGEGGGGGGGGCYSTLVYLVASVPGSDVPLTRHT